MKKTKADLLKKIHGGQVCQIVAAAARLGLADLLWNEPKSALKLAEDLKLDLPVLERLISALVALFLLEEKDGAYHLTSEGLHLASQDEHSLKALASYKGSPFVWAAQGKLYDGVKAGTCPFELAFGVDLFTYLESHPEDAAIFQEAMASYEAQSSTKILDLYDFSQFNSFLDVGGGLGGFAKRIVKRHPHLNGSVLDLPSATKQSAHQSIEFISGDFFIAVPGGYDAYLLRNILHDWSDDKCLLLLKNLHEACRAETKVLIFETFYERSHGKRLGKFSDLTMFTLTPGGKERTLEEIQRLLDASNFKILNTFRTTSSKSLIEAVKT